MAYKIDLSGKKTVITGGGRGLGKAMAVLLAEAGSDVFIGNRKPEQGEDTVKELKKLGVNAGYAKVDVSKDSQVSSFFEAAAEFFGGNFDFCIQNAGIIETLDLMDINGDDSLKVFEVNAIGVGNVLKYALKKMMDQKYGRIVTVASIAGLAPMGMLAHYSASKAAAVSLTMNAAKLAAPYHINVNGIAPGIIRTNMWEEILDSMTDGSKEKGKRNSTFDDAIKSFIPFGVAQTERDIAGTALFLLSDLANEITGQYISIDGGTTI